MFDDGGGETAAVMKRGEKFADGARGFRRGRVDDEIHQRFRDGVSRRVGVARASDDVGDAHQRLVDVADGGVLVDERRNLLLHLFGGVARRRRAGVARRGRHGGVRLGFGAFARPAAHLRLESRAVRRCGQHRRVQRAWLRVRPFEGAATSARARFRAFGEEKFVGNHARFAREVGLRTLRVRARPRTRPSRAAKFDDVAARESRARVEVFALREYVDARHVGVHRLFRLGVRLGAGDGEQRAQRFDVVFARHGSRFAQKFIGNRAHHGDGDHTASIELADQARDADQALLDFLRLRVSLVALGVREQALARFLRAFKLILQSANEKLFERRRARTVLRDVRARRRARRNQTRRGVGDDGDVFLIHGRPLAGRLRQKLRHGEFVQRALRDLLHKLIHRDRGREFVERALQMSL